MNRRGFVKSAAGLVVAAGAGLIVPEPRIWALGWWTEPEPMRYGLLPGTLIPAYGSAAEWAVLYEAQAWLGYTTEMFEADSTFAEEFWFMYQVEQTRLQNIVRYGTDDEVKVAEIKQVIRPGAYPVLDCDVFHEVDKGESLYTLG